MTLEKRGFNVIVVQPKAGTDLRERILRKLREESMHSCRHMMVYFQGGYFCNETHLHFDDAKGVTFEEVMQTLAGSEISRLDLMWNLSSGHEKLPKRQHLTQIVTRNVGLERRPASHDYGSTSTDTLTEIKMYVALMKDEAINRDNRSKRIDTFQLLKHFQRFIDSSMSQKRRSSSSLASHTTNGRFTLVGEHFAEAAKKVKKFIHDEKGNQRLIAYYLGPRGESPTSRRSGEARREDTYRSDGTAISRESRGITLETVASYDARVANMPETWERAYHDNPPDKPSTHPAAPNHSNPCLVGEDRSDGIPDFPAASPRNDLPSVS